MTNEEIKMINIMTIHAIEEYLNLHEYELEHKEVARDTSAYCLLNNYKDELIRKTYLKEKK